ncbi:MAG TPA: glycerol-3-phosphate dehydrogenase [Dongiaceae bacterium]
MLQADASGPVDLFIVGGGINGAGIARDAAGRGLKVVLAEQADLASATSSASTKLIHGGLRYLEYYEFRLVREALIEREVLLKAAPHIIRPLTFVLPHVSALRPAWMVRLGLFLYDHLGGRKLLPGSRSLDLRRDLAGAPLRDEFAKAFSYSDCWVDDARLVVLNARDAADRGARVFTRTRCVSALRSGDRWIATLENLVTGETREISARVLVNAAGPWVADFIDRVGAKRRHALRLVKGSHIIVRRLFDGDHAYILQNDDRRIVFAIPYERDFTLIGTTDLAYEGDPSEVRISAAETDYLCQVINRYFDRSISPRDVVRTYSGVRPLYDDAAQSASAVTRDYVFELDTDGAPLLSIFGGKITTFRKLAEHALDRLRGHLPQMGPAWTAGAALPGGDIANADFEGFLDQARSDWPWLPADLARRLARAYGTRMQQILANAGSLAGLGRDFGDGVYEREIRYLTEQEWAMSADDVLWRRSKLGLHVKSETAAALNAWFGAAQTAAARSTHAGVA